MARKIIPKLPKFKVNLDNLVKVAENNHIYSVDSELRGVVYFARGNDFVVATPERGYIKMKKWDIETLAEELMGIAEDLRFREQVGIKE